VTVGVLVTTDGAMAATVALPRPAVDANVMGASATDIGAEAMTPTFAELLDPAVGVVANLMEPSPADVRAGESTACASAFVPAGDTVSASWIGVSNTWRTPRTLQ